MTVFNKMSAASFILSLILCSLAVSFTRATAAPKDSYYPDYSPDSDMEIPKQKKGEMQNNGFQYGGWVTPTVIDRRNDESSMTASVSTLRLWMKIHFTENVFFYMRGKDVVTAPISDNIDSDNMLDLDLCYINMSFFSRTVTLALGLKYFTLGSGLVLDGRGDGGEINIFSRYLNLKGFASYSGYLKKDDNPYNLSGSDYTDGARRLLAGGALSTGFYNQNVYAFGVDQRDYSDEDSRETYDSRYWGAGLRGVLGDLSYYGEYVYETGEAYNLSGEKKDISAMAIVAGMDYLFNVMTDPVLILQYAYGSGDPDRNDTVSATGNSAGKDENFISFGTHVAGYGLNPSIGNLHALRAGGSIRPTAMLDSLYLRRMTLVAKYSLYLKDQSAAPVNSGEATEDERFVGQGADLSLRWKIFSDLSFFVNYGFFVPGPAYSDIENSSNRHFSMAGLNISF